MKRKVMKIADTTYVVSLPLKWARKHGVKKGDEVEVEEDYSSLKISLEKEELEKLQYKKNIKEYDRTGGRFIVSLYRLGYDTIDISFNNQTFVSRVTNRVPEQTIGFEIIKQQAQSFTLQCLAYHGSENIENIERRIWFLLMDLGKDLVTALETKNLELLRSIKSREQNINKFTNYCIRQILLDKNLERKKSHTLYYFIRYLETVGDDFKNIANQLILLKKYDIKFIETLKKTNQLFDQFNKLYYSFDMKLCESTINTSDELFKSLKQESGLEYIYLGSIVKKVRDFTSSIVELHILESEHP